MFHTNEGLGKHIRSFWVLYWRWGTAWGSYMVPAMIFFVIIYIYDICSRILSTLHLWFGVWPPDRNRARFGWGELVALNHIDVAFRMAACLYTPCSVPNCRRLAQIHDSSWVAVTVIGESKTMRRAGWWSSIFGHVGLNYIVYWTMNTFVMRYYPGKDRTIQSLLILHCLWEAPPARPLTAVLGSCAKPHRHADPSLQCFKVSERQ